MNATGEQAENASPHVFTRIDVVHLVDGPSIDVEAVRRAIELSATRYCSVGGTLATGVTEVHHGYVVRSAGQELSAEVVVTGPDQAIAGLDRRSVALGAA